MPDDSVFVKHPPGFRARRGFWGWYSYFMVPFGLIGGTLMLSILGRVTLAKPKTL